MDDCFYGIRGIRVLWHGDWADPELLWHGMIFNYYALEDALWGVYEEEHKKPGDTGVDATYDDFAAWVKKNASRAREFLQNMAQESKGEMAV